MGCRRLIPGAERIPRAKTRCPSRSETAAGQTGGHEDVGTSRSSRAPAAPLHLLGPGQPSLRGRDLFCGQVSSALALGSPQRRPLLGEGQQGLAASPSGPLPPSWLWAGETNTFKAAGAPLITNPRARFICYSRASWHLFISFPTTGITRAFSTPPRVFSPLHPALSNWRGLPSSPVHPLPFAACLFPRGSHLLPEL